MECLAAGLLSRASRDRSSDCNRTSKGSSERDERSAATSDSQRNRLTPQGADSSAAIIRKSLPPQQIAVVRCASEVATQTSRCLNVP